MEEIEVGEYVRTYDGDITKVKDFIKEKNIYSIVREDDLLYGNPNKVVKKYSKNLIDLIEVKDAIQYIEQTEGKEGTILYDTYITDIHSEAELIEIKEEVKTKGIKLVLILTKEQMKANCYTVEEDK